ncbi:inactive N-acetylated-alpha-linked acidic dipeptidase-like protein 2 [Spea bombifrons]|uniref:inactive N-acetylated-alpha-linked acidic dipeptidase-like protein 2 n=1 Tax=Spea bombifrons TaxID=233779 RepID=UPI00234BD659|nr:inactive N-acetylated-alpha-linked acidic dipeptidase-like protein 2 [Spea bombifrons]
MGEKESNSTSVSLQGQELVYHKLGLRAGSDVPYIESDDIQTSALELEWDMETELEELGTEQYQGDDFANQHIASLQNHVYMTTSIQPSISPKGGFQRLQEEPEYFSHYAESEPRKSQQHCCTIIKMFCTFMFTFTIGILIGYFSNNNPHSANCSLESGPVTSSEISFVSEIVKNISKENIEKHYRYLTQISVNKADTDTAKEIALLWTSIGLKEVQLVNYSVLLDLPGSSPNTITLNNGQCYYPNGQECDEESNSHQSQEFLYSYAAFSAKGTLEGEIVDVQYGTVDDLLQASQGRNITNSFALLKLGVLPLLYKLSLLEEIGFKGALVYVDPCDLPENENLNNKAFMVSLNNGDVPGSSTSTNNKNYWPLTQNFSSLLVQPVAVSLLQKVFRIADSTSQTKCVPLMLPETEYSKVHLKIQSAPTYKDITNVFGFLRGAVLPEILQAGQMVDKVGWLRNAGLSSLDKQTPQEPEFSIEIIKDEFVVSGVFEWIYRI